MNRVRTPELVDRAIQMEKMGLKRKDIYHYFGISESTLRQWLDPEKYEAQKRLNVQWMRANKDRVNFLSRQRRQHFTREQKDRLNEYQKARYRNDPRVRARLRKLAAKYRLTAQYHLALKLRTANLAFSGRYPNMFERLMKAVTGMERSDFTKRFEGDGQLDHIVPLCAFDLTNPEHLVRAAWVGNVQLIPARDNQMKGDSVPDGLDIMSLPWSGTELALLEAKNFISTQLIRLEKLKLQQGIVPSEEQAA